MDKTKIKIVGLGDGGARAVNKLIAAGVGLKKDVEIIAVGKDENILLFSAAQNNIFLNRDSPTIYKNISTALHDAKIVIIVGGLGGSAATAAIPRIISIAKNLNATTVAFANLPFILENIERKKNAEYCLNCLREADTSFIFPAEKFFLFRLYKKEISIPELFEVANEIFCTGIEIFLDMISEKDMPVKIGKATFGYGFGATTLEAIKNAVNFPAFTEDEVKRAKKIFVRLTGGNDKAAKNFIKGINPAAKLFWQVEDTRGEKIMAAIIMSNL